MAGVQGSVLQMVNHGISTGALFLLVGIVYERRHTRMIAEYGGLARQMPIYATYFLIMALSSMGLPILNGFIGEFTILQGAFAKSFWWAFFAATGIVLGAAYLLWLYQRVFFGELSNPANQKLSDLTLREQLTLVPLVILAFWIGLYPQADLRRAAGSLREDRGGRRRPDDDAARAGRGNARGRRRSRESDLHVPRGGLVPPLAGALPDGGGAARPRARAGARQGEGGLPGLPLDPLRRDHGGAHGLRRGGARRAMAGRSSAACSSWTTSPSSSSSRSCCRCC